MEVRPRLLLVFLTLVVLPVLGGCSPAKKYRFEMTLEISTPKGLRRGSSVVEIKQWESPSFPGPDAGGIRTETRGEAAAVKLPGGRLIFLTLLNAEHFAQLAYRPTQHEPYEKNRSSDWPETINMIKKQHYPANLPLDAPFQLVTFKNLRMPDTVEKVEQPNIEELFGPGTKINRVTIEITEKPLRYELAKVLPWLDEYEAKGQRLNGKTGAISTSNFNELGTSALSVCDHQRTVPFAVMLNLFQHPSCPTNEGAIRRNGS